ncbi:MAG TPA: hypothetical protein VIC71_10475 [Gammaproteobacteria bacterium]|jgi:hypothetical protein
MELERVHLSIERRRIEKGGDERIDVPYAARARTPHDGSRQTTRSARRIYTREVERAPRAEAARRSAVTTRAELR